MGCSTIFPTLSIYLKDAATNFTPAWCGSTFSRLKRQKKKGRKYLSGLQLVRQVNELLIKSGSKRNRTLPNLILKQFAEGLAMLKAQRIRNLTYCQVGSGQFFFCFSN